MSTTALDTSVIVAALLRWRADHDRPAAAVARAEAHGGRLVLPVPAPLQSPSVMPRMPTGDRVPPAQPLATLREEFQADAALVAQRGDDVGEFLESTVSKGVSGGGVYDADILACAESAGARRLLTLNPSDFERLGPSVVQIVVP